MAQQPTGVSQQQLIIDAKNFLAGMATTSNSPDGGFSNESINVNLLATVGLLSGTVTASELDNSHKPSGNVIASANDANTSGNTKYFLDDAGNYYTWDGATITKRYTDSNSSDYSAGISDIVQYNLSTYATTKNHIVLLTGTNLVTSTNNTWQSWTSSQSTVCPHPTLLFNKNIYFSDGNFLAQYDGTTYTAAALTLTSNTTITALGIDPSSGRMLVGIIESKDNLNNTKSTQAYITLYDGTNPSQFIKKFPVEDQVIAFYQVGATVFVLYGQNLGFFNGSGITFLRRLGGNTFINTTLPYKHHISSIGSTLLIVEGTKVLAYGPVSGSKQPVFYYIYNEASSNTSGITMICNLGQNKLGEAYKDVSNAFHLASTDVTATGTNLLDFYSLDIGFPRPIMIRRIDVEFEDSVANGATAGYLSILDEGAGLKQVTTTNITGGAKYRLEVLWDNKRIHRGKLRWTNFSGSYRVNRFIIRYDFAE